MPSSLVTTDVSEQQQSDNEVELQFHTWTLLKTPIV